MTREPQTFGYDSVRGEVRRLPLEWGDALPGSGEFTGHLYYLRVGSPGWYYWDGAMWIGPLGVGGGGGAAPASAEYLVGALHPTLTLERLVTNTATAIWDLATAGVAKLDVPTFGGLGTVGVVPDPIAHASKYLEDDGNWTVPVGTGEVNTASNVGTGLGKVYRSKAGSDLELKSILAGTLIDVVNLANEVEINLDLPQRSVGVRQVGPPTSVAFPDVSILARKGSGDITALAFAADTMLGRLASGSLADMPQSDIDTLMNVVVGKANDSIQRLSPTGFMDVATIKDNLLPLVKLTMGGFGHMVRSIPAGVAADAESFSVTNQSVIGRLAGATDVVPIVAAASRVLARGPSGDLGFKDGGAAIEAMAAGFAGTAFPTTNLFEGRQFTRTDMGNMVFTRNASAGGWLSVELFGPFGFGDNVDRTYGGTPFFLRTVTTGHGVARNFSATKGYQLPFATKVVGITLNMDASGTCQVQVGNGATAIAGATLVVTALQSESDFTLLSNTIPAGGIMTMALISGTIQGPSNGHFWVRRFET